MISHLMLSVLLSAVAAALLPVVGVQDLAQSGSIHRAVPFDVDPAARYVIYLHGRIIEDEGVRPTHPQFGVYEYEAILEELASNGLEVISEVRPPAADGGEYARRTARQVRELIAAGVPEDHITVVGFSKGGAIAILASWELQEPAVRFVWLAACGDWAFRMSALVPAGRILSIHEASDDLGVSCEPLLVRSDLIEGKEIRIDTGERHGAFYRPTPEWIAPVVEWARPKASPGGDQAATADPERMPDWVTLLGYEEGELFGIRTGRFGFPHVLEFDDPDLPGLLGPQYLPGKRYTVDYITGRLLLPVAAKRGQGAPSRERGPVVPSIERKR